MLFAAMIEANFSNTVHPIKHVCSTFYAPPCSYASYTYLLVWPYCAYVERCWDMWDDRFLWTWQSLL